MYDTDDEDNENGVPDWFGQPYYLHNGTYVHWPGVEMVVDGVVAEWWWIEVPVLTGGMLEGREYWCCSRYATDPHMPFNRVTSRQELLLLQDAIHMMRESEGVDEQGVEHFNHPRMQDRSLWKWLPPTVTMQNPPEWELWDWEAMKEAARFMVGPEVRSDHTSVMHAAWAEEAYDSDADDA